MKTSPSRFKTPKVSIIICLHVIGERFYHDLQKFIHLKYPNYEIIIVSNMNAQVKKTKVPYRIIKPAKSSVSLGEKRDLGVNASKGTYCAFIDDDAYPDPLWLTNAIAMFQADKNIGAIGGPNCMPPDDGFWEKIGGLIYESYLTSGGQQLRFLPMPRREVKELQGVDMIIRKDLLQRVGGFKYKLYSGDDSKICSEIRELGYKILYDPHVKVYHHRRPFPFQHLKQIKNMGTHRGFFVKAHPETLSPIYFVPALLSGGFIAGIVLSIMYPPTRLFFFSLFGFFYLLGFISSIKRGGILKSLIVSLGIMLTHMIYGINFLRGMTLESIERRVD